MQQSSSRPAADRRLVLVSWLLVAWSGLLRLINLQSPLLEIHSFRQTHNGIIIDWMCRSRMSLTDFETPVFGPPWRLVVDFPWYQFSAASLASITGLNTDLAARATALGYFAASAVLLYRLARQFDPNGFVPLIALLFYLYSPLSFVWSRAGMLDGTAICLSLLFLFCLLKFLRRPGVGWWLVLTSSVCLAAVVKAITVAVFLVVATVWLMHRLWRTKLAWRRHPAARPLLRRQLLLWTVSGGVTVACLLAAVSAWKAFADGVNLASPYTAFHSSTRLGEWLFGTLHQRLDPSNWLVLIGRWLTLAFPVVLAALPVMPLIRWREFPKSVVCLGVGAWSGLVIAVLTFFNLFVRHDYYLWSAVPLLSIVAAFGARWMWEQQRLSSRLTYLQAAVWLGSVLLGLVPYGYWSFRFDYGDPICQLGRLIADVTPDDEYVVMADFEWHTSVLYYAGRRGFMIDPESAEAEPPWDQFRELPYRTVVVREPHPELFANWHRQQFVGQANGFRVYRVSDPVSNRVPAESPMEPADP